MGGLVFRVFSKTYEIIIRGEKMNKRYFIRVYLGYNIAGYLACNGKIVRDCLYARLYKDEKNAISAAEKQNAKNNGYTYKPTEFYI